MIAEVSHILKGTWKHAIHAVALWLALPARSSGADAKQVLAPTGTLRVTFLGPIPVQGRVDAASYAVTGPVADLVQVLGGSGSHFASRLARTCEA